MRFATSSAVDESVPEAHRGKYTAFTLQGTQGVQHLRALREAGLTHLHLLPTYDFGSVPERAEDRREPGVSRASARETRSPQMHRSAARAPFPGGLSCNIL
jgi:pullulanase/glycogen debranching enzyme